MYFYIAKNFKVKYGIIFSLLFFFSCQKKQEKVEIIETETSEMRIVVQHPDPEKVMAVFELEVASWNELENLKIFLNRFKKASANEVLSNALELKDLIKVLKENNKPAIFDNPSFQTRIDILENESLRLADMSTIPAISAKEVNMQVDKILTAFSAVNAKINTTLSKKKFEDEITIDVSVIGLDSTKMDTISKKSILRKLEEVDLRRE